MQDPNDKKPEQSTAAGDLKQASVEKPTPSVAARPTPVVAGRPIPLAGGPPSPPDGAQKEYMDNRVPPYALLFFDHLYSEYQALDNTSEKQQLQPLLQPIIERRSTCTLTWSDIYTFDLALVNIRPAPSLIRKAFDARARYRNIAGQKEYDEYLASKPPDLSQVPFQAEQELRADIKYLLSKFYLYYSILPVREGLRDEMTRKAVLLTSAVVIVIGFAIAANVAGSFGKGFLAAMNPYSVVLVTALTVVLAGIIGGCVSMLQRIQSAPSEGDALFNMAALTNGKWGIILSPLYGGIFAALLFVLFAAGVLQGSIFPKINTPIDPSAQPSLQPSPSPTPAPRTTTSATPVTAATPTATTPGSNRSAAGRAPVNVPVTQDSLTASPSATPTPAPTSTPIPTPTPLAPKEIGILQIKDFLRDTGPRDGLSYSLLIIWSFLAGFLERLVPDTLNRLVAKSQAIQGTNS